jgi:hypothetical protein
MGLVLACTPSGSTFGRWIRVAASSATSPQPADPDDPRMDDPDVDDALLTAAERAREAEKRLTETPPEDPTIVPKAEKVHQRAEEVDELAQDAVEDAEKAQE